MVAFSRTIVSGTVLLSTWSQSIRDKEFLVEMRLQNLESGISEQKTDEKGMELPRAGMVGADRAIAEER